MVSKSAKAQRKLAKQAAKALVTPGKPTMAMETEVSPESVIPAQRQEAVSGDAGWGGEACG